MVSCKINETAYSSKYPDRENLSVVYVTTLHQLQNLIGSE